MSNLINKSNLDDNSDNEAIIERLFPKCRPRLVISKSQILTKDDNQLIDNNFNPIMVDVNSHLFRSNSKVEKESENIQILNFKNQVNSVNCDYNSIQVRLNKENECGNHQFVDHIGDQSFKMELKNEANIEKLCLKESKIQMYKEKETIGYHWNTSTSPQKLAKKASYIQNECLKTQQNSKDSIFLNNCKQYSITAIYPSQDVFSQKLEPWDTVEHISSSLSTLPFSKLNINSRSPITPESNNQNLPQSNHSKFSIQDDSKLNEIHLKFSCDVNNGDCNIDQKSKSPRLKVIKKSSSLPSFLDYSQKLTFDLLSCKDQAKNERLKEKQQLSESLEMNEFQKLENETMYIGNVPIARYDGSPRRYRPKQPESIQQTISNENISTSKHAFKLSLDELVKSILNISLSPQHSPEDVDKNFNFSAQSNSNSNENHDCDEENQSINKITAHKLDERIDNLENTNNMNIKSGTSVVIEQCSNLMCKSSEPTHSNKLTSVSDNLLSNRENLTLNCSKAHRKRLMNKNINEKKSDIIEAEEKVDLKNFIQISRETSECESNDNDSDTASFEDSLYSNSRYNKMPILEDGLSSGFPSSEDEFEEKVPSTNARDSRNFKIENSSFDIKMGNREKVNHFKVCSRNHKIFQEKLEDNTLTNRNTTSFQNCEYHHHQRYHQSCRLCHNIEPLNNYKNKNRMDFGYKLNIPRSKSLQLNHDHNQPILVNHNNVNSSEVPWSQRPDSNHTIKSNIKLGTKLQHPNSKLSESSIQEPSEDDCDTDQETDKLLGAQRSGERSYLDDKNNLLHKKKNSTKEVLIEGILFRARYLGSTQIVCEGQPTKATRMMHAEEAVSRIKSLAPDGGTQPSTEVDLFISTEKIMVLNTDMKEIMMDHPLRTISYIADIGDILVLMTRRRLISSNEEHPESKVKRVPKMICHIFESEEAQFIAQSIGQAFQVAYMEFLKANGIEDSSFVKEMDYQEVLNSQEIFGNELEMFAKKDRQKEVIVPKQKGEILGLVIVESGWGSMLPTVVIANISQQGPTARCGHLNIGDQIIAINGVSLVGLPLSTCQNYIKNTWSQTAVKLTVVPCAPVVEVKIKRPNTKYQLGFSVQNGVICSLLRGGIAERGGVRVGHRIIEINGQSVVAVPHERIVNLLATSIGQIAMKTMPTSMFRLLTGQETRSFI